eukprot:8711548-Pyramimonas_sp.AAC.1
MATHVGPEFRATLLRNVSADCITVGQAGAPRATAARFRGVSPWARERNDPAVVREIWMQKSGPL